MKKNIKITLTTLAVLTAAAIIVPIGITKFSKEEVVNNQRVIINMTEAQEDEGDTDGVSLADYEDTIGHKVNLPDDAVAVDVVEEDEDTGAVTVNNEDGDIEVINDKALEEAQKANNEADEILQSALSDVAAEDDTEEVAAATTKTSVKEVEQVKETTTSETADTTSEIDQETKDLFADLGWGEPTTDHSESGIPEDAVWDIQNPDKNYSGTFTTP